MSTNSEISKETKIRMSMFTPEDLEEKIEAQGLDFDVEYRIDNGFFITALNGADYPPQVLSEEKSRGRRRIPQIYGTFQLINGTNIQSLNEKDKANAVLTICQYLAQAELVPKKAIITDEGIEVDFLVIEESH